MEKNEDFSFENWAELPTLDGEDALVLANTAAMILDAKKARELSVIDVRGRSDITDYLVLASATSSTHIKALAGELTFRLGQRGVHSLHEDGRGARDWQIVDFGDVIVHIFDRNTRAFYNLDKLYKNPREPENEPKGEEESL